MKFRNAAKKFGAKVGAGSMLALGAAGSALATTSTAPDVSGAVTAINDMVTPIGAIGRASLLVVVAIKTWKYLRRGV